MPSSKKFKFPDVIYLLAAMWVIHAVQWLTPGSFHQFGILPRTLTGLFQIPLAPFIHGSWFHLIANSFPLLGLGILVQLKGRALFWELCAITAVLAGFGTWLIGSNSYHIGASALVLGLWAYVLADAIFQHSIRSTLIALVTLFFYSGLIFTVFDLRPSVSWSGHASGILAGVLIAWLNARGQAIQNSGKG